MGTLYSQWAVLSMCYQWHIPTILFEIQIVYWLFEIGWINTSLAIAYTWPSIALDKKSGSPYWDIKRLRKSRDTCYHLVWSCSKKNWWIVFLVWSYSQEHKRSIMRAWKEHDKRIRYDQSWICVEDSFEINRWAVNNIYFIKIKISFSLSLSLSPFCPIFLS